MVDAVSTTTPPPLLDLANGTVTADGGVHEFADSQFGHLFASGPDRETARKNLVMALKELFIMGEIRTTVEYLGELLETQDFKDNTIDTAWLDGILKEKSVSVEIEPQSAVINAAVYRAYNQIQGAINGFQENLAKGQLSTLALREMQSLPVEITYQDIKYSFTVKRRGPDSLLLSLGGEDVIDARIRERSDGVLLGIWGGRTHEIDGLEEPLGLRMVLDGQTWLLPNQFDPSELRTDVTGKLIRFLQDDGGEVVAGKPYAPEAVVSRHHPSRARRYAR